MQLDPVIRTKRARRWQIIAGAMVATLCAAATTRAVVDLTRWHDAGAKARTVASSQDRADRDRIEAIVVMHRDAVAAITLLREIEKEGGSVGASAANALAGIREQSR